MKTITLDFSNITSMDEVYKVLKSNLCLPDYFGYNLDALYDVLTDISKETQIDISLSSAPEIYGYMRRLYTVFSDAQEDNPNLYVNKK